MAIYRLHLKPSPDKQFTRANVFEFCQSNNIIGVGWSKITTRENSEEVIKKEAEKYYTPKPTSAFKALNAMRSMEKGDLIWTRLKTKVKGEDCANYYLCRVTDLWENSKPTQRHNELDVPNYVSVEWTKIGPEEVIPGKIVSSFRPSAAVQRVKDIEDISQYMWNKYSGKNDYNITLADVNLDIWTFLSDKSIEELVLLYLQVKKGFYILSQTLKSTTRKYECPMINAQGIKAYQQVKSGSVTLNANDYCEALERDQKAQIYLFTASEKYIKNSNPNFHYITRRELEDFMRENHNLLPELTRNWLEIAHFT